MQINKSKQTSTCPLHIRTTVATPCPIHQNRHMKRTPATPCPLHSATAINAQKCSSLSTPFSSCKQQQRETNGPARKAIRKQTIITLEVNK
jgi:hypothetical protein